MSRRAARLTAEQLRDAFRQIDAAVRELREQRPFRTGCAASRRVSS